LLNSAKTPVSPEKSGAAEPFGSPDTSGPAATPGSAAGAPGSVGTSGSATTPSPQQLEQAFALFNRASAQLATAYHELEQQVSGLSAELLVANGELRRQFEQKEGLSQRLSLLLDALPGGVVVLDRSDTVVEANPAAIELFGGRVFGRSWSEAEQQCLAPTGTPHEWRLRRPDGALDERWVSISASQLDPTGGRILLLSEVTDAYRMRDQLERHKRLSAMGEMAAGLAHQLRTPLATALLYAGNLARKGLAEADRQRFAEKAQARLRDLERMIHDMLTFVRGAPSGGERIVLADLVQELTQVMEPQMAQRGVRFRVDVRAPAVALRGNHKALSSALVNLLENALQANAAGGEVGLHGSVEGDRLLIRVSDRGTGMPPEVQERLFQPFFTTRPEGTGLGLAIVRSVVDAHGGEITVESEPGRGSTFCVRLPLHAPVAAVQA
jgi:two-component system, sensor histidine kinase FlrB